MPNRWLALIFSFVCLLAPAHAADLPAHNREIKVDLKTPPAWDHVGWVTIKGKIYILYSGDLYDASGSPTNFKIDVTLTVKKDSNYEISKVNGKKLTPPVKTFTEEKFDVSASSEKKLPYELIDGNEDKMAGEIIFVPVEVMVNNTKIEEYDLVAVSKGQDEDLATDYSIKVKGLDGLTADLSVKGTDGDIKFKDTSLTLKNNAEAKTKLWGKKPSSARDKTIILASLKHDSKAIGEVEEEVTVFKGVRIEFSGVFGSPIDSVLESWRPGSVYSDDQSIINLDVKDWTSRISFQDGDQSGMKLRNHSPKPNVAVTAAHTITPIITLFGVGSATIDAEIKSAQVWFQQGRFEPTGKVGGPNDPSGKERILGAVLEFKRTSGQSLFKITSTSDKHRISLGKKNKALPIVKEIAKASTTSNLAKWLHEYQTGNPFDIKPRKKAKKAGGQDSIAFFLEKQLSRASAKYSNDSFKISKGNKISNSFATKGLLGAAELNKNVEFLVTFEKWNGWTLTGEANKGALKNK